MESALKSSQLSAATSWTRGRRRADGQSKKPRVIAILGHWQMGHLPVPPQLHQWSLLAEDRLQIARNLPLRLKPPCKMRLVHRVDAPLLRHKSHKVRAVAAEPSNKATAMACTFHKVACKFPVGTLLVLQLRERHTQRCSQWQLQEVAIFSRPPKAIEVEVMAKAVLNKGQQSQCHLAVALMACRIPAANGRSKTLRPSSSCSILP
mmetsp:Transcript_17321/g.40346  ORF Transcript_17321/g.40346 Transcript_17321/m.40346 type:complete len:206 (-) Transcript_17321:780-1397(-)